MKKKIIIGLSVGIFILLLGIISFWLFWGKSNNHQQTKADSIIEDVAKIEKIRKELLDLEKTEEFFFKNLSNMSLSNFPGQIKNIDQATEASYKELFALQKETKRDEIDDIVFQTFNRYMEKLLKKISTQDNEKLEKAAKETQYKNVLALSQKFFKECDKRNEYLKDINDNLKKINVLKKDNPKKSDDNNVEQQIEKLKEINKLKKNLLTDKRKTIQSTSNMITYILDIIAKKAQIQQPKTTEQEKQIYQKLINSKKDFLQDELLVEFLESR